MTEAEVKDAAAEEPQKPVLPTEPSSPDSGTEDTATTSATDDTAQNGAKSAADWRSILLKTDKAPTPPCDWGIPGKLTEEEVNTFIKFQKIVEERGGEFRDTIYCFGEEEGEEWTLCRWLRARKFNLSEVVKMVEEATEIRADAKKCDFYPDPTEALGSDPNIFQSMYPQLYTGSAKNGCPMFISKPGLLNVDGIECVTTFEGILKYHWFVMMHDFAGRLQKQKEADKDFMRFECFCILDLDHLTAAQVTSKALSIIKQQTQIDSLCFPETMNKMVLVNAPRFFTMTWKMIRGWLDPRTAGKIEMHSSRSIWEKRLLELVDADKLPKDYGGTAEATTEIMLRQASADGGMKRRIIEIMAVRSTASLPIDLSAGEELHIIVYTRSTGGAKFELQGSDKGAKATAEVIHKPKKDCEDPPPTCVVLAEKITQPGKYKIHAKSHSGRFTTDKFLVVCSVR